MKRFLIAALAIAMIAIRALLPDLRVDEISVALLGIVCLAILWSDLGKLAMGVRRFRLGDFEVELAERVEKLAKKAEKAEDAQPKKRARKKQEEDVYPDAAKRVAEAASDPRSALLLVAIEIEQAVRQLAEEYGLPDQASTGRIISQLGEQGFISPEVVTLFRDFWQVRNDVVHRAGFNIAAGQIYALVDVGLQILKLLSPYTISPIGIPSQEAFGKPTVSAKPRKKRAA